MCGGSVSLEKDLNWTHRLRENCTLYLASLLDIFINIYCLKFAECWLHIFYV